jgi:hypothetical protein
MRLRSIGKPLIITLISITISSCGASLAEYQRFANAGKSYAVAMDGLLATSGNLFVEANSEALIDNDLQDPAKDRLAYADANANVDAWLKLVGQARQHTDLLKRYFIALENLATSDSPQKSREATEKIFVQLNTVGALMQPSLLANPLVSEEASKAYSTIPKLIIANKIRGNLRAEIETRKEAIFKELVTQDLIQKLLSRQIRKNLVLIQAIKDRRTVKKEYVATVPVLSPQAWIDQRSAIRRMTLSIDALDTASDASQRFKEAFVELVDDRLTIARANALLDDVEALLKTVKDLQTSTSPKE